MATRKSLLWVPERGEIIFIQYNPQVGKEMPNDHPMLVISTKSNSTNAWTLGAPSFRRSCAKPSTTSAGSTAIRRIRLRSHCARGGQSNAMPSTAG